MELSCFNSEPAFYKKKWGLAAEHFVSAKDPHFIKVWNSGGMLVDVFLFPVLQGGPQNQLV